MGVSEPIAVREKPPAPTGKVADLFRVEGPKVVCTACARYCKIGEGQVGLCGVRGVHEGKLWLYVYGRVITGHVDPIEKKPVMHYRPGSKVFSIATTGCNWLCHPAGTPITMADGDVRPVEEIRPGDALLSLAEVNGPVVQDIVTAVGRRKAHVVRASIGGLRTPLLGTPEHPVLTARGWIEMSRIQVGEWVLAQSGRTHDAATFREDLHLPPHALEVHPLEVSAFLRRTEYAATPQPELVWSRVLDVAREGVPEPVYSFECVPFHNYLASGIVVHNCRYCFLPGSKVATDEGSEDIEAIFADADLTDNPEVRLVRNRSAVTHRGRYRRIRKAFQHFYSGSVMRLVPAGLPPIECTPDHQVFAAKRNGPVAKARAEDLAAGDSLAIPTREAAVGRLLGSLLETVQSGSRDIDLSSGVLGLRSQGYRLEHRGIAFTRDYALIPIERVERFDYVGPVYNIEVVEDHSYTVGMFAVSNCQNYDISQRRKVEGIEASPEDIVRMTVEQGCQGLAYTYNQPTIFIEYARDVGLAARRKGIFNIFVSNGYDTPETVAEMAKFLDCVTVDFKGSGETDFVRKYINIPNADPIYETMEDVHKNTKIHMEVTDLIVPQVGDNLEEARKLCRWIHDNLGPEASIHFLRWHPDYKMMDLPPTPVATLEKHCEVAKEEGLQYVYIGNVPGHPLEHTYCPACDSIAIRRYGFDITGWYLDKHNRCKTCGHRLPIVGRLEKTFREDRFYSVMYRR